MRHLLAFRPLLVLGAVALSLALQAPSHAAQPYRPGEVVVRFRDGAPEAVREAALGAVGVSQGHAVGHPSALVVHVSGWTVEQAIERLQARPEVVWAEPNYIVQPLLLPNDPRFPDQWPLRNLGQSGGLPDADIRATLAWDLTPGSSSVLVGIIDSGVDYTHPDLAPNVFVNPGEIEGNGVDDDANGYVDDVRGWDFFDGDNDPMDPTGHGTHVAGIIGASGNDSIGITGVCWRVRLLPLRFLGNIGGTSAAAAEAIRYATRMGARLTNNSWGNSAVSNVVLEAITEARDAGVLFVAAAGNSSRDNAVFPIYPASYDLSNIVSVAATDSRDRLAPFSNFGATTVDLGAPGVDVLSTVPGGGYALASGTSMSSPYAAGALALLLARIPELTGEAAKARLLGGVTPLNSLAGRVRSGGRLDAFVPMAPPDSIAPSQVLDLRVVRAGGEEVELAWTATGDDDRTGRATRYELRRSPSPIDAASFPAATPVETPPPKTAGATEQVAANGLAFSSTWYFALVARDERGNGSLLSNVVVATTLPPPDVSAAPLTLSAALVAGETAQRAVTLSNTGASDLRFEARPSFPAVPEPSPWGPVLDPPGLERSPSGVVSLRMPRVPVDASEEGTGARAGLVADPETAGAQHREAPEPGESTPRTLSAYVEDALTQRPGVLATRRAGRALAGGLKLLILVQGTTTETIAGAIAEHPDVSFVDQLDASIDPPPLSLLAPYDAVIVVNNQPPPDAAALGDVLADYVDQGGGVVLTLASFVRGFEITGRFIAGGYAPFGVAVGPIGGSTLGAYEDDHPIMRGVQSLSGQQLAATEPAPDAHLVASWANGEPFVCTRRGRVVGVNVFVGDPGGYYFGDVPRVIAQSAVWTRRGRWLSAEPAQGVIPPGGSVTLTVAFDASGISAGPHDAALEIHTNDPDEPVTPIAAHLDVSGVPDLSLIGEPVRMTFERSYTVENAQTSYEFIPRVPPAGPIAFELIAEGDFGDATERAVLFVEGSAIAGVGSVGADCVANAAIAPIDAASFALWMQDRRIQATVLNSADVNPFCGVNRHLLTLRYPGPVDPLSFGLAFVAERRTLLLRVVNRGSADLVLGAPELDRPEFRATAPEAPIPPGASAVVAVEFTPATPSDVTGTLIIPSNDPDTPRRTVRLTGSGAVGPRARIEPLAIDASLPEAAEGTRPLTIANDGESMLHARIEVRPALPPVFHGARGASPGGPRSRTSIDGAPALPRLDEATFHPLASSPTPITCVIEDPANGTIYGQQEGGRRFFRYRAATDTWEELATVPIAAHNNGGSALLRGRVYNVYPTVSDSITVYDIASGSWSTRAAPVATTAGIASDGADHLYAMRGSDLVRYDPETGETTHLSPAPFVIDPWCSLRWFEGRLYVHEATGRRRFVAYDTATHLWTTLAQLPAAAVLGAAIDPMAREYVTRGPVAGFSLYRYSIDGGTWATSALTPFPADQSGMGWLPSPVPGVCLAQGENGTGFVRFVDQPEFLRPEVAEVTVAPHAVREVAIALRAGSLPAASYEAALSVTTDDPGAPETVIPVRMTVVGAPRLLLAGASVTRVSAETYESRAARTIHVLPLDPPPAGSAMLRLEADGNFGVLGASATLQVEGRTLGTIASFGIECDRATAEFFLSQAELMQLAVDGRIDALVQNSFSVNPAECVLNRHRLILTYVASATELAFGSVALGQQSALTIEFANTGSAPLTVHSVTLDRAEFSMDPLLPAILAPGERRLLEARFAPVRAEGVEGTVTVVSDDPTEPTRVVRMTGSGREPPVLRLDATPIQVASPERIAAGITLELGNDGASPLVFELFPRYVPPATPSGEVIRRASSPVALTCMTSDPAARTLYAQQHGGVGFHRYRADEDRWEPLANAPVPALNDGGAAFLLGRIYFAYADQPSLIAAYDVASASWSLLEHPLGRTTAAIASDGRRFLYVGRAREVRRWDPTTGETTLLPRPPFTIENWSTLVWFDETLFAFRGNQTTEVARLELATGRWTVLQPTPDLPMLGGAVDPVTRELVATGSNMVFRYPIDVEGGGWILSTVVGASMKDGGLAWLPGPVAGVYLPQGEYGPGLSLLVGDDPFVVASPDRGVLAPGQVARIDLRLGAESLPPGIHEAELRVLSDDPQRPRVDIPLQLEVQPRPILTMEGPATSEASRQLFFEDGALTVHRFVTTKAASGAASLELAVVGDFGDASEFAEVSLEGIILGEVGGGDTDCVLTIGRFVIAPAVFAAALADGVVEVSVRNSPGAAGNTCPASAHTVTLAFNSSLDPLELGTVFLGDTARTRVTIANPGGSPLSVTVVTAGDPAFSATPAAATIPPGGRLPVEVAFAPRVLGGSQGSLVVRSDDPVAPERTVALDASGASAPLVRVTPEALSLRLGPGLAVERAISVANVGGAELEWSARAAVAAPQPLPMVGPLAAELPLEDVLRRLDQRSGEITALIPSLHEFREGVTGHGITDGGGDMYDGGNILSTNHAGPIPYSDGVVRVHAAFGAFGRYVTRKLPGLFVLAADLDGVTELRVSGNLGHDGFGFTSGVQVFATRGQVGYRGLSKRVYGTRQPSVNHLVVVQDRFGLAQVFPPRNTDDDEHLINGLAGARRVYYLLYSSLEGGLVGDAVTDSVMNRLLDVVGVAPAWLTLGAEGGSLPAGGEATVPLTLDASLIGLGDYHAELIVESSDPFDPRRTVPIRLRVVDTPVAEPAADTLRFPDTNVGHAADRELTITNLGGLPLTITGASIDAADFAIAARPQSIEPGEEGRVRVTFRPVAGGARSGTLTVTCDDPERPTLLVGLQGNAGLPPAPELRPESTHVTIDAGQIATRILSVCQAGGGVLSYTVVPDSVVWLSVRGPLAGTLAEAECAQDTLVLDARGLTGGVLHAAIRVRSNDPVMPERLHRVTLEVRETQNTVRAGLRVSPRVLRQEKPKHDARFLYALLSLPAPNRRHDLEVQSVRFNGVVPLVSLRDHDDDDDHGGRDDDDDGRGHDDDDDGRGDGDGREHDDDDDGRGDGGGHGHDDDDDGRGHDDVRGNGDDEVVGRGQVAVRGSNDRVAVLGQDAGGDGALDPDKRVAAPETFGRRHDPKNLVVLVFDRAACLETLPVGDRVAVAITGRLRDGRLIVAYDTVRVLPGPRPRDHDRAAALALEAPPASLEFSGGAPNPFSTSTRLRYGLPRGAHVRLEVFDLAGRRRRVVLDAAQPAGWHEASWDGRDDSGALVAPGVFVMRLASGAESRTRRIARLPGRP